MCGGRSVWVPCSRVSHVYRGHSCSSCHSGTLANKFKGQPTTLRNYKRVIETWFDDKHKEYFYTREPLARYRVIIQWLTNYNLLVAQKNGL